MTPLMGMVTVINPMLILSGWWVDHLLVGLIQSYCFLPVTAILLSLKTVESLENICLLISLRLYVRSYWCFVISIILENSQRLAFKLRGSAYLSLQGCLYLL